MARIATAFVQFAFTLKKWRGLLIGYALIFGMFLVLVVLMLAEDTEKADESWRFKRGMCRIRGCKAVCRDVDWRGLNHHLARVGDYCASDLDLTIQLKSHLKQPLEKNWLNFLPRAIKRLKLKKLGSFKTDAFAGYPFSGLGAFSIAFTRLDRLEKRWFHDLTNLQELIIVVDKSAGGFWIEGDFLEGKPLLQRVSITAGLNSSEQIGNLTRTRRDYLPLKTLDLTGNRLRFLTPGVFTAAYNLQRLNLHGNLLENVHADLIPNSVTSLRLSNNYLRELPRDFFESSLLQNVELNGNPWNCGCGSQWLSALYALNSSPINKSVPLVCADGRRFEDVDFDETCFNRKRAGLYRMGGEDAGNGCQAVSCKVECTGVDFYALAESISAALSDCVSSIDLTLTSINFPENEIPNHWLQTLKLHVTRLELKKCAFTRTHDDAFSTPPFTQLAELTLVDPSITHIAKTAFGDSNYLTSFALRYDAKPAQNDFWIEAGSFGNLSKLNTLQLIGCLSSSEHINNITGTKGEYMKELLTLDARFNHIEAVNGLSFVNAPKLLRLYLNGNLLREIAVDAFVGSSLVYLEISDNLLRTLPAGVFAVFEKNPAMDRHIFAFSNPWRCECELQWFKDYCLRNNSVVDAANPPLCSNLYPFEETDFACETSTETSVGTTRDHEQQHKTVSVPCRDITRQARTPKQAENFTSVEIFAHNHSIQLTFADLDEDFASTQIIFQGNIANFHLLWFNTHQPEEKDCITKLHNKPIYLSSLKRTQTYTFCLVYEGDKTVSPYSCFGATIPEVWAKRAWLTHAQQPLTITIFTTTLLATATIFAVTTYFLIFRFPALIKRNKRVILLGGKVRQDNVVDSGYLTPNCPLYERVNYRVGGNTISAHVENAYKPPPLPPCHPVLGKLEEEDVKSISVA